MVSPRTETFSFLVNEIPRTIDGHGKMFESQISVHQTQFFLLFLNMNVSIAAVVECCIKFDILTSGLCQCLLMENSILFEESFRWIWETWIENSGNMQLQVSKKKTINYLFLAPFLAWDSENVPELFEISPKLNESPIEM